MASKIRVAIVKPSGNVEFKRVVDGQRFQDSSGNRYDSPKRNDICKVNILGIDFEVALYQSGIPKARPAWILPSPGLTGQDLNNVDGDWLINLVRRALLENEKEQLKNLILMILCGVSALASIGAAIMSWSVMRAVG